MQKAETPVTKDDIKYVFKQLLEMNKISEDEYQKILEKIAQSDLCDT